MDNRNRGLEVRTQEKSIITQSNGEGRRVGGFKLKSSEKEKKTSQRMMTHTLQSIFPLMESINNFSFPR